MDDVLDFESDATRAVRAMAAAYPETVEEPACVKTKFRVRKKSFAFVGAKADHWSVMLKLRDSMDEARAHAGLEASGGKGGWVTLKYPADQPVPAELARWMDESFRLQAPKTVAAQVPPAQ